MSRKAAPQSVLTSGCSLGTTGTLDTWQKIIQDYGDNHSDFRKAEKDHFGSLSLDAAIKQAALCRTHDDKRQPHQYRYRETTLVEFHQVLANRAATVRKANSFHYLFCLVKKWRTLGVGELGVYDVAHRIGINRKLLPEKVYLHAGTRKGAVALGLSHKNRESLEMHELPKQLQQVTAEEAEDILCIYKDKFRALRG